MAIVPSDRLTGTCVCVGGSSRLFITTCVAHFCYLLFIYRFDRLLVVTLDRLDGCIDRLLLVVDYSSTLVTLVTDPCTASSSSSSLSIDYSSTLVTLLDRLLFDFDFLFDRFFCYRSDVVVGFRIAGARAGVGDLCCCYRGEC